MGDHKTLFKSQSIALSPVNHNKINRERQRVARTKKREECFQNNRVIDVSPTPMKKFPAMPAQSQSIAGQENVNPQTFASRKELYMQRFMKWKAENREKREKQLAKAQKLHQPQDAAAAAAAPAVFPPQKRRSLYIVIDPKTSKSTDIKRLPVAPSVGKAITLQQAPAAKQATGGAVKPKATTTAVKQPAPAAAKQPPPAVVKQPPSATVKQPPPAEAKSTSGAVLKPKTPTTAVTPAAPPKKPPSQPTSFKRVAATAAAALAIQKPTTSAKKPETKQPATATKSVPVKPTTASSAVKPHSSTAAKTTRPRNLMTQPFDRPANAAKIVKPIRAGGAPGKFKSTAPQKSTKALGMSDHSRVIKLKKAAPTHSKQKLMDKMPNLKKELLQIATDEPLPETPIDAESNENPFQAQATSTHCKGNSCSEDLLEAYRDLTKLSPVMCTATPKTVGSTVKRQLIPPPAEAEAESKQKPKFNFVRYSEGFAMLDSPTSPAEETVIPAATAAAVEDKTMLPQTPPQSSSNSKTTNYLSPFVSVSRGKVNSQTERRKRDSMYLQDEGAKEAETPVALRRTLDAVNYFRLQLQNEIQRLHSLCDEWNLYSKENEAMLVETGGKDMIDAAIGQTKLLTSKKLMQFSSLIDRCESGATGVGLRPNDGSEETKPVLAEDLQGWWDMINLQSDNVDKRFANLGRWRANEWQDPDALEKPKPKVKVTAKGSKAPKTKPAAKASSNLRSFLRKAKAEQRKNQEEQDKQLTDSPTRRIIVVRDRKSFSPARTVLRLSIGSGSRPSMAGNGLLKSAIMGAAEQKSRQQTPPASSSVTETPRRMSILKTPGTKKREPSTTRGVMFSAKKSVRRFQFAVEEGNISGDDDVLGIDKLEDCEEDMSLEKNSSQTNKTVQAAIDNEKTPEHMLRTCQLRSRKVRIRPSHEFM
ncbi:guanylate kinase-associated protein mars [Drosophila innubila]|uniref:guanylate kinase-associated protein mars n=1 Tax=Drosophila innubila TaxID=198719 RepID=UPI00148B8D2D|nr:guanylate kinase-associated protein mars [Drosophila innubila]